MYHISELFVLSHTRDILGEHHNEEKVISDGVMVGVPVVGNVKAKVGGLDLHVNLKSSRNVQFCFRAVGDIK